MNHRITRDDCSILSKDDIYPVLYDQMLIVFAYDPITCNEIEVAAAIKRLLKPKISKLLSCPHGCGVSFITKGHLKNHEELREKCGICAWTRLSSIHGPGGFVVPSVATHLLVKEKEIPQFENIMNKNVSPFCLASNFTPGIMAKKKREIESIRSCESFGDLLRKICRSSDLTEDDMHLPNSIYFPFIKPIDDWTRSDQLKLMKY